MVIREDPYHSLSERKKEWVILKPKNGWAPQQQTQNKLKLCINNYIRYEISQTCDPVLSKGRTRRLQKQKEYKLRRTYLNSHMEPETTTLKRLKLTSSKIHKTLQKNNKDKNTGKIKITIKKITKQRLHRGAEELMVASRRACIVLISTVYHLF
jgi:hypothetical protein